MGWYWGDQSPQYHPIIIQDTTHQKAGLNALYVQDTGVLSVYLDPAILRSNLDFGRKLLVIWKM